MGKFSIKSLFIEEVEEQPKQEVQKEKSSSKKVAAVQSATPTTSSSSGGEVSEEFLKILMKAVEDANIAGNDWLEFKAQINILQNAGLSGQTLYTAAFATLSAQDGMTKAHLLQTIDKYTGVIDNQVKVFDQELQSQSEQVVGSKEREVENMTASIQAKKERIEKLQDEISELQDQKGVAVVEVNQLKQKAEEKVQSFHASVSRAKSILTKDKEAIEKFIL